MVINYNRGMSQRGEFVTPETATTLLRRHLNPLITVTAVRKLYGGSVNRVLELVLDREPGTLVAKVHDRGAAENFVAEMASLRYLREHTHFPVPVPMACIEDDAGFDGSMLIMQKISGTTLESATLSAAGRRVFEVELATAMIELHGHTAESFGPAASSARHADWLEVYGPTVEREVAATRAELPSSIREVVDHVRNHLGHWLDHKPTPTLIHGDLWANNILINDAHPDRPRILAFIDSHASFADPEYELAYLQLFKTVGRTFFDVYGQSHRIDEGYHRRSMVYWLIATLQHARVFGQKHIHACERIARELRRVAK